MIDFRLPSVIAEMVSARNNVRDHYADVLRQLGAQATLKFTLDGNLVGDIGEAIAVELFGIRLVETKSTKGIDGHAPNGKTVQIKATGTSRGPAFRQTDIRAEHLLFFDIDFNNARGIVVFNGPEHHAFGFLPSAFEGQRSLTATQIRKADRLVSANERLSLVGL
jgi:hypothetical protein